MAEPAVKLSTLSRHLQLPRVPSWLLSALLLSVWARPAAAGNSSPLLISLLGTLVVALLLVAMSLLGYLLATFRRNHSRHPPKPPPLQRKSAKHEEISALAAPRRANEPTQVGPMLSLSEVRMVKPRAILLAVPVRQTRVCSVCQREFPSTLSICPVDQGPLVDKSALKGSMQREDYLDTHRSIMVCDGCGRHFDLGANFCLYDGKPLSAREDLDEAASGDSTMVCPRCGQVYDSDSYFCPDDGERLLPDQPDALQSGFGALPIVICPRCATEFPSGNRTCPRDGQELLPLVGRKTGGTPIHGIGPKKKVCPTCGQRFGLDAIYCSSDACRLLSMN